LNRAKKIRANSGFIRTRHAPPEGSSAYGPLQITKTLMVLAKPRLIESLSEEEADYVNRFIEQADKFLKYGREPDKEGYHERYDYGGQGDLTSTKDRELYKSVGKKLIELVYNDAGKDLDRFIQQWRYESGTEKRVDVDDPKYYKAYMEGLNSG
jgi:hypothetical protein